jgi:tRNA 2-thiouridine synthesizing protein A
MEEVDVTGEVCPRPALIVRRELADLDPGEDLLVRGDYPPAEENLKRTCTTHGFEVDAAEETSEDRFELRITVTEDAADR